MRIAIASGKGGTGKTTLAVNLAHYLSQNDTVLLMDLDVEEPNSGIFIQADLVHTETITRGVPKWDKSRCTLCGKCNQVCQYGAVLKLGEHIMVLPNLCHSCYACSELCPANALPMQPEVLGILHHYKQNNLDFVESRLEIGVEQASPLIAQSLAYIDKNMRDKTWQILDSPPGTSCAMISATKTAEYTILITEPTPFGLYDLSLAVETMRHLDKPFGVVINRYGIGNDDVLDYLKQENIPLLGKIPNQRIIAELYSRGDLIYPTIPAFEEVLQQIEQNLRGQNA